MIAIVAGRQDAGLDSPGRAYEHGMQMRRMLLERGRNGQRRHEVPTGTAAGEEDGRRADGRTVGRGQWIPALDPRPVPSNFLSVRPPVRPSACPLASRPIPSVLRQLPEKLGALSLV